MDILGPGKGCPYIKEQCLNKVYSVIPGTSALFLVFSYTSPKCLIIELCVLSLPTPLRSMKLYTKPLKYKLSIRFNIVMFHAFLILTKDGSLKPKERISNLGIFHLFLAMYLWGGAVGKEGKKQWLTTLRSHLTRSHLFHLSPKPALDQR